MRRGLRALLLAGSTALLLAAAPGLGSSPRDPLPEYPVKAAFLYHFVEFVEWPPASPLPPATVTIGVLGRDPFGDVLDKAILEKMVAGRTLAIRRFASVEALEPCEILFISSSEMAHLPEILARLRGSPRAHRGRGRPLRAARGDDRVLLRGQPRAAGGQPGRRGEGRPARQLEAARGGAAGEAGRRRERRGALMRFARDLPLRHKLTLLVTLTSGLVLSLACLILAAYDLRRAYQDLETDLGSLAQVIGSNSTGALTFDDPRAADEILAAMSARPHIVSARLYDAEGQPFATYHRRGAEARRPARARPARLVSRGADGGRALPGREAGPGDGGHPLPEGRPRPGAVALRGLPGRGPAGDAGQHGGGVGHLGAVAAPGLRSDPAPGGRRRARWPRARTTRCAWPVPAETSWAS